MTASELGVELARVKLSGMNLEFWGVNDLFFRGRPQASGGKFDFFKR